MTSLADRTISALRAEHDTLAGVVAGLDDEQLAAQSGAAEWPVAQVLSHLGSGAEIFLATLGTALGTAPPAPEDFNQSVWARWDAMSPRAQADGFLEHNATLVAAFEAMSAEQRESTEVDLGFLPAALPFSAFAAMRLNEASMHGWDVRVAYDDSAALTEDAALLLLEHLAGALSFMTGFAAKADAVTGPVALDVAGSGYGLTIDDAVAVVLGLPEPTAVYAGPVEAAVRLIGGRLTPQYTPGEVEVTGNVTLDELRAVFPGY